MESLSQTQDFDTALARSYADLLKYAKHLTRSTNEAQDLVHDTIERGLRHRDRFQYGSEPKHWLTTILKRLFVDSYRTASRWRFQPHPAGDVAAPEESDEAVTNPWWDALTIEDLRQAVESLDSPFREVYSLHALEGLSYQEVATRLCIPIGTVGTRALRARQKLREMLELEREVEPSTRGSKRARTEGTFYRA